MLFAIFFYIANVSFNAIHENKIIAKISEFTVDNAWPSEKVLSVTLAPL